VRHHPPFRTAIAAVVLAITAGCGQPPLEPGRARVTQVVDGDTIVVDLGAGEPVTVRILGIDTPETHHPTKPVQCYGPEAEARLHELLPEGTVVELTRDVELHDLYGRLLATVRRDDGLAIDETMAAEGYADALTIPPNTARAAVITDVVAEARRARRGRWGAC
jgi:micrococcal nuclease